MQSLPAIEGGQPVRPKLLPYSQQWVADDDIEAVIRVLRSDFLTTGPKIKEFEEMFANYVGTRYAVAIANGTAALHAAMFAAGVGPGDEVITTPITFAASANCVLYQGGLPVFADVLSGNLLIDPMQAEAKITERTRVIIPVHYSGHPAPMDEILALAGKYNLLVVEDAAHALGARYKGQLIGGLSDMTVFSFHPVKHITTGEGGMITTNRADLYEQLLLFRAHGITRDPRRLGKAAGPWYYEMQALGYNYRMTDIQAALGISQLAKSEDFLARRREIAAIYTEAFTGLDSIEPYLEKTWAASSWHLYVIKLKPDRLRVDRNVVFDALRAENIGVNVHYIPVYLHPYYRALGYQPGLCPQAEEAYERIISLPVFPAMTDRDVHDVITAVRKVMAYYAE